MGKRNVSLDVVIQNFIVNKITQNKYNQKTAEIISDSTLDLFEHIKNPMGYYITYIKPNIKQFGNNNEIVIIQLDSFLFSIGHEQAQYYKNNTKYSKETTSSKMKQFYEQINKFVKKEYQLSNSKLDNINDKVLKCYYKTLTIK